MCRLPNSDPVPVPPPPVKWAQRPDVVLITIPLSDITEEQLSVSEHKLSIRWVGEGEGRGGEGNLSREAWCYLFLCVCYSLKGGSEQKGYSVELDLFKPVVPSDSCHSKSHRELFVLLRKRESGPYWSQLVRGSSNVRVQCVCVCVCVCVER